LPGERFSPKMTERQADALLRSDLRKLCAMFRGFGRDSLLLAALAYNVGCGKVMKSRMYAKMRSGNRNIYRDYVDFKRWNGKIVPSIERRRKMEYLLLFTP
jgi:lysozyme